jgi:hypothetical protein
VERGPLDYLYSRFRPCFLPHHGQKWKNPCETGPRQPRQRSGRCGWDQGRPGLRLHMGQ